MEKASWKRNMIIGAFGTGLLLGGTFYYFHANTETLYRVSINGSSIGYVTTPAVVTSWLEEKKRATYLQKGYWIDTDADISFDRRNIFNGKSNDSGVLEQLKDRTPFYILGASISVNNEVIGYVKNYTIAEEALNHYKTSVNASSQADRKEKQTTRIASLDDSIQSQKIEKSFFKELIILEQNKVDASQILDKEEILQRLSKEREKQLKYVTGDGEPIQVTVKEPLLTVITNEEITVEEDIPFAILYQEDNTLPKGAIRIKRQGSNGKKRITYKIRKENGKLASKTILSENIIREPMAQLVIKGNKIIPSVGTGKFIWPVNGGIITSGFAMRADGFHAGIDIAGTENKDIKAADHGVVESVGWVNGFGKSIVVNHNNQYKTRYSHLSKYLVKEGDLVEQGQVIAVMGSTGNSTGIHLDFRIMKEEKELNPLNFIQQP